MLKLKTREESDLIQLIQYGTVPTCMLPVCCSKDEQKTTKFHAKIRNDCTISCVHYRVHIIHVLLVDLFLLLYYYT